jgi:hypothetical protein
MNFLITNDRDYKNDFSLNVIYHNNFKILFDDNWISANDTLSKGTANNYCTIKLGDTIEILHNEVRDFPLWFDKNTCSNFTKLDNYVPVDGRLNFNNAWQLSYQKDFYKEPDSCGCGRSTVGRCVGWHNFEEETYAVALIKKVLLDNTKEFLKCNTLDILVPNNNGLDTLTVRSVLDYLKVDYKLFDIEKLDYKKLQSTLEKDYYGFNQIQEFESPKCVITGFYGDEYILRNPFYVQNILKSRGQDIVKIFDNKPNCYMRNFFDLVYREKCAKVQPVGVDKVSQMICNDIQVWHINNTMIFTPFKDKRLLKLLECDSNIIIDQVTDGKLSKMVIESFNKDLLKLLDESKNNSDPKWFWQANPTKEKFDYENEGRFEKDSKLYQASWLINQFAYALAPIRPVRDSQVNDFINQLPLKELRQDIDVQTFGDEIINWINKSRRVNLKNAQFSHTTLLPGIDYGIESLLRRSKQVGFLSNSYYGVRDYCDKNNIPYYHLDENIEPNSTVIIELPTPNHDVENTISFINKCKNKNCYVALDMTFLPVFVGSSLQIDLTNVDEVWFSMNKTWPIHDVRTSLRYSKQVINDMYTVSQQKNTHNKIGANILKYCIEKFGFDYTFYKYIDIVDSICEQFAIAKTNNLWLAHKQNVIWTHMPSKNWNYDNLIGLHGLIENKSKYFW